MPLAGKGMLLTSMNVDSADEAEFNRWYDREHLEERVAIPGFLEARRYVAHDGNPKYLSLYSTETFEVLDSRAYRTALANQTAWSKTNIARFIDEVAFLMNKQTDEEILTNEVSDDALEAAGAAISGGAVTLIQGSYCFTCGQEEQL